MSRGRGPAVPPHGSASHRYSAGARDRADWSLALFVSQECKSCSSSHIYDGAGGDLQSAFLMPVRMP